jgi:hypothetical protein
MRDPLARATRLAFGFAMLFIVLPLLLGVFKSAGRRGQETRAERGSRSVKNNASS